MSRKIGKEELKDIIQGATLLGSGGGGSPKSVLKLLDKIFEKRRFVEIVSPNEVPDNARVVATGGMGSPAVLLKEGWKGEELYAVEKMEKLIGKIDYLVPAFTGPLPFAGIFFASATKDLSVVDGDGAGRGTPELDQTTFYLGGVRMEPVCLAEPKGNSVFLYPRDTSMGLEMARAITQVFGMSAGIACYPMNGKQLKATVVPGTLTLAERIGRALREAKEGRKDIIEATLKVIDGYLLAKGKVKKKTEELKATFDVGKVEMGEITVGYIYENIIAWKGKKPVAMLPDSICWLGLDGSPLTNTDIKEGMKVAAIGIKSDDKWRVPKGLELIKPTLSIFGYKGEYEPIEELVKFLKAKK
jgi:hypothetical protein